MTNKGAIVLGSLAIGGGALVFALSRKAEAGPPPDVEVPEGDIVIEIFDAEGNPVPRNSPVTLNEGQSYTARVTVRNMTTRGGVSWPADLTISTLIYIGNTYFYDGVNSGVATRMFAANEQFSWNYPFTVPALSGGQSGIIDTRVISPAAEVLATAQEPINIAVVEIIYGATIVIS